MAVKYFSKVGSSEQITTRVAPTEVDWIEMNTYRPLEGAYIATANGEWQNNELQMKKDEAKQNLETLINRLRAEQSTFNGITVAKTYENINEWLTFAKYKADENLTIPAQAVMMSYSGQNMNAFSVPQIEGAMYQAMVEITSINANYYTTLARIESATTAEEIPNIQG